MRRVLLASRNAGKIAELARMLEAEQIGGLEIVGLDQVAEFAEVPETGATFGENALLKARAAATATGMAVIAGAARAAQASGSPPASRVSNCSSVSTGTPNCSAVVSLLPAPGPATT